MRKPRQLFVGLALAMAASAASAQSAPTWPVARADVAKLEQTVHLPAGARAVGNYARYYIGLFSSGHRTIQGLYRLQGPRAAGIYLNQRGVRPMDGGCGVVAVNYDAETGTVLNVSCNGIA